MESSLLTLARKIYHRYLRIRTPRFYALKEHPHGMLNPMIYQKIYSAFSYQPSAGGGNTQGGVARTVQRFCRHPSVVWCLLTVER